MSSAEPEVGRIAGRKGAAYSGAMAALQLLLPGAAILYYGDEIGMDDTHLTVEQSRDLRVLHLGEVCSSHPSFLSAFKGNFGES